MSLIHRNSLLGDTLACFVFIGLLPIFLLLFLTGGIVELADYARSSRE